MALHTCCSFSGMRSQGAASMLFTLSDRLGESTDPRLEFMDRCKDKVSQNYMHITLEAMYLM